MKKMCLLTAIVLSAVMLLSSCGISKRRAVKVELYAEDNEEVIGGQIVYNTFGAETMEDAVECFAESAPELYGSEAIRQVVAGRGEFFIPDNGDEIISYDLGARTGDLTVIVKFRHGEDVLCVVKSHGDLDVRKMTVGDKSVYYRTDEIDGEDIITSIFYKPEGGELLQIFKATDSRVDNSIQFTEEEITALGEEFFNFKSADLKDYFGSDYVEGRQ